MLFLGPFLAHKNIWLTILITGAAKKLHFYLQIWYIPLFKKNLNWARFLGSVFEDSSVRFLNFSSRKRFIIALIITKLYIILYNTSFSNFLISGAIYIEILQHRRLFIRIRNMEGIWIKMCRLALRFIFCRP